MVGAGCGGDEVVVFLPESLEKVAGADAQSALAGGFLPVPLAVTVRTADGSLAPRGMVRWTFITGTGGVLSDSTTMADGAGQAQITVRLGAAPGAYGVRAQLVVKPVRAVEFTATALAPPTLASISPAQFGGGDSIVVTGTGLDTSATLVVSGVPARLLGVTGGSTLTALAPVCLAPGPVSVGVRIGAAVSNQLPATYQSQAEPIQLAIGDYAAVEPARVAGCALFPPAGSDTAEYLIAPQQVSGAAGDSVSYRLRGDSAALPVFGRPAVRERPFSLAFHDALRAAEADFAGRPRSALAAAPSDAATAAEIGVGDRRTFRVCSKFDCNTLEDFSLVDAEARYVGKRAALYQDLTAPAGGFATTDFETLGALFDEQLYDVATRAFGAESDVDLNGRVLILFTPVVNRLTPAAECSQAFVTGFFFGIDIDPAFANDDRSNHGEVFYAIVPDSAQTLTCRFTVAQVRRLVPVTFIHEFQHMISYHQRVLVRGASAEELWLNEAMSHLAEELGAFRMLSLGDTKSFSEFAIGDLLNAFVYLKDPEPQHMLFKVTPGTIEERGASWLFLRWVVDQFGDPVIRRLSETSLRGQQNIAAATSESVPLLLTQWFLANYVSDLPGVPTQGRLRYRKWNFRTQYANLNAQSPTTFDRPFPIVPPVFTGGMFDVSGYLRSGSGAYFRVRVPPGPRGTAVQLTDGGGGALNGAAARLNVVRLK